MLLSDPLSIAKSPRAARSLRSNVNCLQKGDCVNNNDNNINDNETVTKVAFKCCII